MGFLLLHLLHSMIGVVNWVAERTDFHKVIKGHCSVWHGGRMYFLSRIVIRFHSLPALASLPVIGLSFRMGSLDSNLLTCISQGQDFQMGKETSTLHPQA